MVLTGCRSIRKHDGTVIAQDQATSAVWGMPGAVANAGLANRILPLSAIASEILRLTTCSQNVGQRASGIGGLAVSASSAVDYPYLRQLVFNQSQNVLESSARLSF